MIRHAYNLLIAALLLGLSAKCCAADRSRLGCDLYQQIECGRAEIDAGQVTAWDYEPATDTWSLRQTVPFATEVQKAYDEESRQYVVSVIDAHGRRWWIVARSVRFTL